MRSLKMTTWSKHCPGNRTNDSLDLGVLPWRAWRCNDFSDAHRLDPFAED